VLGRSNVAKFLYLYAMWLLIHTFVLSFVVPDFDTTRAHGPLDLLEELTITPTNLWYLYALALYFAVAKATRRAPKALILGVALALSVATAAGAFAVPGNRGGLLQNLVFFLAGLHFRAPIERLAAAATWRRVAATGGAYTVVLLFMPATGTQAVPGVWTAASIVAVVFGVTAMARVARWAPAGTVMAALGRRTLPIYVLHMPLLALAHRLLLGPLSNSGPAQPMLALVEPLMMTAALVLACLGLHRAFQAMRAGWLFDLPRRRSTPARAR
jgi:uncharacterized membrane protein YcfT